MCCITEFLSQLLSNRSRRTRDSAYYELLVDIKKLAGHIRNFTEIIPLHKNRHTQTPIPTVWYFALKDISARVSSSKRFKVRTRFAQSAISRNWEKLNEISPVDRYFSARGGSLFTKSCWMIVCRFVDAELVKV